MGYRALIHGYQNRNEPEANVYHVGSGTSGSRYNAFKVKLSARNSVYLNYKNMPLPFLVLNILTLTLGWLIKLRFFGVEYRKGRVFMKTTIVIPNYNGKAFMEDCLTALAAQTVRDFEVLVVDNGSTDGSVDGLDAWFPGVRVISFEKNYGFSRAVNEGIRQSRSEYVILLNNDTIPFPDYVERLVGAIEADRRIFSVSPKMIQACNRHLLDDAGDSYCVLGWAFQRGVGQQAESYSRPGLIFSSCA